MRRLTPVGTTPIAYHDPAQRVYLYIFATCSLWLCERCYGARKLLFHDHVSECFAPLVSRCECREKEV